MLASSEALRTGNLAAFHKLAQDAVKTQIVYNYVLTDRAGHQILNTLRPYGAVLPGTGTPPALDRVFTAQTSVLTDYFIGPVTGKSAIAMGVPVFDSGGKVIYSLNVGLAPDKLSTLLKAAPLPQGWLAALLDSSGTIVGRTRDVERFVGQKAVPELRSAIAAQRSGTMEALTKEGSKVATAFETSSTWKWSVAVGAPKNLIEERLNRAIAWVAVVAVLVAAFAAALALAVIRHLTETVENLNDAALAINEGKLVEMPKVTLAEADAVARAIVRVSELTSEVHYRAYHDGLTDLGNRALFYEFLERNLARSLRDGSPFSLVMLDLDHFKEVNDQEGHAVGDAVLKQAAERIRGQIRAGDLAARLGGDEFAVLLANSGAEGAMDVARRLNERLAEPYSGCAQAISASIGVVSWHAGLETGSAMMELADRALYEVKTHGRNGARLVEPQG